MKSIALIIPWYGPFHNYFDLWLQSAAYNNTIDFFLITDNDPIINSPPNVHFIAMAFSEIKKRFEENAGFPVKISPYKLCDFKPLYGLTFQDIVGAYDYWGHCDVDLIFGDIRHFLTDEVLSVERVLQRGHFSLYKNNEKMNYLFKKTALKDNMAYPYTKAWTTNYSCYFDEFLGMNIVTDLYCTSIIDHRMEDMVLDPAAHRYTFCSDVNQRKYYCRWKEGHLYRQFYNEAGIAEGPEQEYMYLHLQKRTMKRNIKDEVPVQYYIVPNAFLDEPRFIITEEDEDRYTKEHFRKDRQKNIKKLRDYGIIPCITHRLRRRKIDKWLFEHKPGF